MLDLSRLKRDAFWAQLDQRGLLHPFDAAGKRRDYRDIPRSLDDLVDDPFRSLAGELRRAGGYAKDTTPYSEFLWADFLRRRIKRKTVESDFAHAMESAMKFAKRARGGASLWSAQRSPLAIIITSAPAKA